LNLVKNFSSVAGLIAGADYSIANLETRLAGAAAGYSGYPLFNCPADLATEIHTINNRVNKEGV